MILSIHSSAAFQIAQGWPKVWPPVELPPPSPLAAAAKSLWAPKLPGNETNALPAQGRDTNASLYSTQLSPGGQSGSAEGQAGFQVNFIDQRTALLRYDASHAEDGAPAPVQDSAPPVSVPVPAPSGVAA
jgi:hypothetical protein